MLTPKLMLAMFLFALGVVLNVRVCGDRGSSIDPA